MSSEGQSHIAAYVPDDDVKAQRDRLAQACLTRGLARALYYEGRVLEKARPGHAALLFAAADALDTAHRGLLRALDYRAGSPEALDIKADVRDALRKAGFEGSMGEVGSRV